MEQTMKTKQKWLSPLLAALPLAMLFLSCDADGVYKTIEFKLHGAWESTDTALYSGRLVIGGDTITITGYAESQTPWKGDALSPSSKAAALPAHAPAGGERPPAGSIRNRSAPGSGRC
jgi:hypothetical protein